MTSSTASMYAGRPLTLRPGEDLVGKSVATETAIILDVARDSPREHLCATLDSRLAGRLAGSSLRDGKMLPGMRRQGVDCVVHEKPFRYMLVADIAGACNRSVRMR